MKIAVLFGSFNPMTNAHLAAMKEAVAHLGADRGLFVATNGKYLKKKTVKHDDAFYLSEEERKEIIEKACEGEEKLAFWGFEMGGISPKRYKTLSKIQKEYPNAELYEIQGADKVRSIPRFGDGEEYVSHVRFAVFARGGIDLAALLDTDPLLCRYKDRFHLLPALSDSAEISSTEVRRRFYAGESYTDIVPQATATVMARYSPADFTLTFAERMAVMMKDGRFGPHNARKEVYALNTKLFNAWKAGNAEIELGDYHAFLDGTKLYERSFDMSDKGTVYPDVQTGCLNIDCIELAEKLLAKGYDPAILNLASAKKPGGGYRDGMGAQEESLCYASTLSLSLYQYSDPKYINIRESGVPVKKTGYPLDINFGGVYTPNVTFFRNNAASFYTLRERSFCCDVITVAALSFNGRSHYAELDELSFRSETGGFTPAGEEIMKNKIRTIFRMGVEHGKDALVLGAFGCGAYRLPAPEVAKLFRVVMEEPEFKNKFRLIVFAILERAGGPQGPEGKFAAFYREFGTYQA